MFTVALLAGLEASLNRVLRLDATALPRLAPLAGRILEIHCTTPDWCLYLTADGEGLRLASQFPETPDCRLQAPASALVQLILGHDRQAVLHSPEVVLAGDSQLLLHWADILQNLQLDWEYALSPWLGPVATGLLGQAWRQQRQWLSGNARHLEQSLAEYLTEEARSLVGRNEAEAYFSELDALKVAQDRLDARLDRLTSHLLPNSIP